MIRSLLPQDLRRPAGTAGALRISARPPQLRLAHVRATVLASLCLLPLSGCSLFQDDPPAGDNASIVPPSTASAEAAARSSSSSSSEAQAQTQEQAAPATQKPDTPGQPGAVSAAPPDAPPPVEARQPTGAPLPAGTVQTAAGTASSTGAAPQPGPQYTTAAGQPPGAAGAAPQEDQGEAAHAVPVASSQSAPAPAASSPLSLAPAAPEAAAAGQVATQPATQVAPQVASQANTQAAAVPGPADPAAQYQTPTPPAPQYQTATPQYQAAVPQYQTPTPPPPQYAAPIPQYQPPVPAEPIAAPGAVGQAAVKAAQAVAPAAAQAAPAGAAGGWQAAGAMGGAGAQLPVAAGAAGMPGGAGGARHGSVADQLFAREAALDVLAELDAAQMAQAQAQSAPVKQFAARLLEDYGRARQMLLSLAAVRDDPDATALDPAHQRTLEDLARLRGQLFDVGYLRAEAAAHQKTAELYEWILGTGRDPSVKGYAVGVLPTVLQELESAQSLLGQLGPSE